MFNEKIIIFLIVLFGFFVRIAGINEMPPSLNWDEVSHGYNAYSILKTAKDEWGQFLPLANFRAYGDYPLPANLYITIPSIVLFGLNEFSIRFPHALLGAAIILSTFFLVSGLKLGRVVALLAALFIAIDPWTVFPSRAVFQSNVASFFLITGTAFFLYRKNNLLFLPFSMLLVGISLYSYHNTRIFVPLLLVTIVFIWMKEWELWISKKRKIFLISVFIITVFILPLPHVFLTQESRARSTWVFILDQGSINRIVEAREQSDLPESIKRLVYNRYSYFISEFAKNYVGYFSPQFLFVSGGTNYQFSIPGKGVLYPINAPFFYIGLLVLVLSVLKKRKPEGVFIISWLILGLIPAAITQGQYHVIRSSTIIPIPQILVAVGLVGAWQWWGKSIRYQVPGIRYFPIFIYVILLLFFFEGYAREYIGPYRTNYSWSWQYGYKEAVEFMKQNYKEYDQIIMTKKYGEPHEFILFYGVAADTSRPWDPEKYRNDPNLTRFAQSDWFWVDRFDKFYFVNDWQVPRAADGEWRMESGGTIPTSGRTLLITSPSNYPPGWNQLKTINFLGGKPAFEILEKI